VKNGANTKMSDFRNIGFYTVTPNVKVKPLDDKRVRQALSMAIDRQSIATGLMKGRATVPTGFLCQGDFAYDSSKPPMPYDQAKARDLLRQAGYNNEEIFIESQRNILLDNEQQVCEAIISMWRAVGVNAKLELIEPAVRAEKNRLRNYKGHFTSYFTSVLGDPDGFMWRTLQPNGGLNYGVTNDEFIRLGREANGSFDQPLRERNYKRMNEIFLDELPTFPIIEATLGFGLQKYIDFTAGPVTSVDFRKENLTFK
jgi:peptide/nickel transport system substrate-binding protein